MANINNYTYTSYTWQSVHFEVERRCHKVRERVLKDMKSEQSMLREEILHKYALDNTLLDLVLIPKEEMAALLQWFEMSSDIDICYCNVIFDAICNLWNYISDRDVEVYGKMPIEDQLEYVKKKKMEFLIWYLKCKKISARESQMLITAIHMPLYHRINNHSMTELMISYLLC